LRITGGTAKNRKLLSPGSGWKEDVRPTGDRVREAVFSILGGRVRGALVLDLYAGSGSLGLEALSRGAAKAVFVDRSPLCLELIRRNVQQCFPRAAIELVRLDLRRPGSFTMLKRPGAAARQFDLIFLDPPYQKKLAETTLAMVDKTGLLAAGGLVIAEERRNAVMPVLTGRLSLHDQRRYGETGIWIYGADFVEEKSSPAAATPYHHHPTET
jgi:16S rRNA (guanine966-N2)-methyltransferase